MTVKDRNGRTVFESGALNPNGSIRGNDNDADPARSSRTTRRSPTPIRCRSTKTSWSAPTTCRRPGLLTAVRFIKDNRLLPNGFDKTDRGPRDRCRRAAPRTTRTFTGGGDKIRYSVPVGNAQGPFQVEAELWFQPISYRWANNLKPYNAAEPKRFVGYYDAMSSGSAVMLVRASAAR